MNYLKTTAFIFEVVLISIVLSFGLKIYELKIKAETECNHMQVTEVTETTEATEVTAVTEVTESTTEYTSREEPSYSAEDFHILMQLITGEAQNQSEEIQIMVGSVALNRLNDPDFPNTLREVAYQRKQYACFTDGNAFREPTALTLKVVDFLLTNGSQLPANVVYQAQFKQGSGVYAHVGNQYFCFK